MKKDEAAVPSKPKPAKKSANKAARAPNKIAVAARRAVVFLASTYLSWILAFPKASGLLGQRIGDGLIETLGATAYALPLVLFFGLYHSISGGRRASIFTAISAVGLVGVSVLCAHVGAWSQAAWFGGEVGRGLNAFFSTWLGTAGSFLFALALILFSVQAFFEIPWVKWGTSFFEMLRADLAEWQKARAAQALDLREEAAAAAVAMPAPPPIINLPEPTVSPSPSPLPKGEGKRVEREEKPEKPAKAAPKTVKPGEPNWKLPSTDILESPMASVRLSEAELQDNMRRLEATLANFGISVKATACSTGPVITQYELTPAPGVKVSSISARASDIALAMRATSVRIVAPIPGKAAVGIEIPNPQQAKVVLREILESSAFRNHKKPLGFTLGKTVEGTPTVAEISSMPHLLVAGATNSGKSVLVHSLILSILYRSRPDEVKLLLIDPKRLELTFYEGIPHLYDPRIPAQDVSVLTQPKEAAKSLAKLVEVMADRYEKYKTWNVRDIESFNQKADEQGLPRDYYIVVVIDELADLILVAQKAVEDHIQRLAQMARAVGIHLVLATQRPSVDVITGVIKANLPARIALAVRSIIDSRVILDVTGAESLLGRGDMLYLASGQPDPVRLQGPFVSESEITRVADFWRAQGKPSYQVIIHHDLAEGEDGKGGAKDKDLQAALKLVLERRRVSQDLLKAHFGSSARATDLLSTLEVKGFINKPEGTNRWEIFFDKIEDYLKAVGNA